MKSYILKYSLCASVVSIAFCCQAGNLTLPGGRVLEDAYVMAEEPDGLEICHKNGVTLVKFRDLPADIQKKYSYDPVKADAYEKQQKDLNAKREADEIARKKAEADAYQKALVADEIGNLSENIEKTKIRIDFLKSEIPKLESQRDRMMDRSNSLAAANPAGSSGGDTSAYYSGVVDCSSSGDIAEYTRKKVVDNDTQEYADLKHQVNAYKTELQDKQLKLIEMQKTYSQLIKSPQAK